MIDKQNTKSWDTLSSSQVWNCDVVVLKIYEGSEIPLITGGLNCESLAYNLVS